MPPKTLNIVRLIPLGIVVSALLMAYFHAGLKALNPLDGYKLWPKVSKNQFLFGLILLGIIEILIRFLR
jgi:accessory gene regulator protein AgrB